MSEDSEEQQLAHDEPLDSEDEFQREVEEQRKLANKNRHKKARLSWKSIPVNIEQLMMGSKESGFLGLEEIDYDTWVAESKHFGVDPESALLLNPIDQSPKEENSAKAVDHASISKTNSQAKSTSKKKKKKTKPAAATARAMPAAKLSSPHSTPAEEPAAAAPEVVDDFQLGAGWREFELEPEITQALRALRFKEPTPIQKEVLRKGLVAGCDVLAASETVCT